MRSWFFFPGMSSRALHASIAVQREEGGIEQIESEDEDPRMRQMYVEECAKNGIEVNM